MNKNGIPKVIYKIVTEDVYFSNTVVGVDCSVQGCEEKVVFAHIQKTDDQPVFYFFCENHETMLNQCWKLARMRK